MGDSAGGATAATGNTGGDGVPSAHNEDSTHLSPNVESTAEATEEIKWGAVRDYSGLFKGGDEEEETDSDSDYDDSSEGSGDHADTSRNDAEPEPEPGPVQPPAQGIDDETSSEHSREDITAQLEETAAEENARTGDLGERADTPSNTTGPAAVAVQSPSVESDNVMFSENIRKRIARWRERASARKHEHVVGGSGEYGDTSRDAAVPVTGTVQPPTVGSGDVIFSENIRKAIMRWRERASANQRDNTGYSEDDADATQDSPVPAVETIQPPAPGSGDVIFSQTIRKSIMNWRERASADQQVRAGSVGEHTDTSESSAVPATETIQPPTPGSSDAIFSDNIRKAIMRWRERASANQQVRAGNVGEDTDAAVTATVTAQPPTPDSGDVVFSENIRKAITRWRERASANQQVRAENVGEDTDAAVPATVTAQPPTLDSGDVVFSATIRRAIMRWRERASANQQVLAGNIEEHADASRSSAVPATETIQPPTPGSDDVLFSENTRKAIMRWRERASANQEVRAGLVEDHTDASHSSEVPATETIEPPTVGPGDILFSDNIRKAIMRWRERASANQHERTGDSGEHTDVSQSSAVPATETIQPTTPGSGDVIFSENMRRAIMRWRKRASAKKHVATDSLGEDTDVSQSSAVPVTETIQSPIAASGDVAFSANIRKAIMRWRKRASATTKNARTVDSEEHADKSRSVAVPSTEAVQPPTLGSIDVVFSENMRNAIMRWRKRASATKHARIVDSEEHADTSQNTVPAPGAVQPPIPGSGDVIFSENNRKAIMRWKERASSKIHARTISVGEYADASLNPTEPAPGTVRSDTLGSGDIEFSENIREAITRWRKRASAKGNERMGAPGAPEEKPDMSPNATVPAPGAVQPVPLDSGDETIEEGSREGIAGQPEEISAEENELSRYSGEQADAPRAIAEPAPETVQPATPGSEGATAEEYPSGDGIVGGPEETSGEDNKRTLDSEEQADASRSVTIPAPGTVQPAPLALGDETGGEDSRSEAAVRREEISAKEHGHAVDSGGHPETSHNVLAPAPDTIQPATADVGDGAASPALDQTMATRNSAVALGTEVRQRPELDQEKSSRNNTGGSSNAGPLLRPVASLGGREARGAPAVSKSPRRSSPSPLDNPAAAVLTWFREHDFGWEVDLDFKLRHKIANGRLIGSCLALYYPAKLDLADFNGGNKPANKNSNWNFVQKFMRKRGYALRSTDVTCLCTVPMPAEEGHEAASRVLMAVYSFLLADGLVPPLLGVTPARVCPPPARPRVPIYNRPTARESDDDREHREKLASSPLTSRSVGSSSKGVVIDAETFHQSRRRRGKEHRHPSDMRKRRYAPTESFVGVDAARRGRHDASLDYASGYEDSSVEGAVKAAGKHTRAATEAVGKNGRNHEHRSDKRNHGEVSLEAEKSRYKGEHRRSGSHEKGSETTGLREARGRSSPRKHAGEEVTRRGRYSSNNADDTKTTSPRVGHPEESEVEEPVHRGGRRYVARDHEAAGGNGRSRDLNVSERASGRRNRGRKGLRGSAAADESEKIGRSLEEERQEREKSAKRSETLVRREGRERRRRRARSGDDGERRSAAYHRRVEDGNHNAGDTSEDCGSGDDNDRENSGELSSPRRKIKSSLPSFSKGSGGGGTDNHHWPRDRPEKYPSLPPTLRGPHLRRHIDPERSGETNETEPRGGGGQEESHQRTATEDGEGRNNRPRNVPRERLTDDEEHWNRRRTGGGGGGGGGGGSTSQHSTVEKEPKKRARKDVSFENDSDSWKHHRGGGGGGGRSGGEVLDLGGRVQQPQREKARGNRQQNRSPERRRPGEAGGRAADGDKAVMGGAHRYEEEEEHRAERGFRPAGACNNGLSSSLKGSSSSRKAPASPRRSTSPTEKKTPMIDKRYARRGTLEEMSGFGKGDGGWGERVDERRRRLQVERSGQRVDSVVGGRDQHNAQVRRRPLPPSAALPASGHGAVSPPRLRRLVHAETKQREYPDDRDSSRPRAVDHQHPALAGIDGYTHEPGSQNSPQPPLRPENGQRCQGRDQEDRKRQDLLAEKRVGFDSYADGGDSNEVDVHWG